LRYDLLFLAPRQAATKATARQTGSRSVISVLGIIPTGVATAISATSNGPTPAVEAPVRLHLLTYVSRLKRLFRGKPLSALLKVNRERRLLVFYRDAIRLSPLCFRSDEVSRFSAAVLIALRILSGLMMAFPLLLNLSHPS
jgi:hypothetical protein